MSFPMVYSALQKRISKVKLDAATGATEAIVVFLMNILLSGIIEFFNM